MNALRNYVKVNDEFSNSINLYLDLNNKDKVKHYIPTSSSVLILKNYLSNIEENRQNATLLIGPYGKGKSHLLLLLLALLSMERNQANKELFDSLVKRIALVSDSAASYAELVVNKDRFLPVIISSTQGDLNHAFMIGLSEALKREKLDELSPENYFSHAIDTIEMWKTEYKETYDRFISLLSERNMNVKHMISRLKSFNTESLNAFKEIYPYLTSGSVFNPLVNGEVITCYKNVASAIKEQYGYRGIYIIFDEFSKYIESQDKKDTTTGNNMKVLQDVCELANTSKEPQIFITLVAHKAIKEYGKFLSTDTINAFTGIEGRTKEIQFIASSKNNYELIKNAISLDQDGIDNDPRIAKEINAAKKIRSQIRAFSSTFTKEDYEEIVARGCYPLTPLAAYLLLNISEKVAQNERTLFTFISKDEQYSMIRCIDALDENDSWAINADCIYDYFSGLFKNEIQNELIHTEWLNAEYAIEKVESAEQIKVIKSIALINIVNKNEEVSTTPTHIRFASGIDWAEDVLNELESKQIIYRRHSDGSYAFKTRATSRIQNEIKRRMTLKGASTNINDALISVFDQYYILPKKYNYLNAMTRYYISEFMNVKDFLTIANVESIMYDGIFKDGKVLFLYSMDDNDYSEQIEMHLKKSMPTNLVCCYSHNALSVVKQIQEYEVIQDLKKDIEFFNHTDNGVLRKGLPILEDDVSKPILEFLQSSFGIHSKYMLYYKDSNNMIYSHQTRVKDAVDLTCANTFCKSIIVNNELINKETVKTSPIKKACRNIIEKILLRDDCEQYLTGTSADATIYRAIFINTGISNGSYNDKTGEILTIIDKFLVGTGTEKKCIKELVDILTSAPYGVRKGILPLVFAERMSKRNEEIVIYFGEEEQELNPENIINMCLSPEDYSIFVSPEDILKEEYLNQMCNLFSVTSKDRYTTSRLKALLEGMQKWYRALPLVTKNIKGKTDYFNNEVFGQANLKVKNVLQGVRNNPYEVIFVKLPEAFNTGEFDVLINLITEYKVALDSHYDYVLKEAKKNTYRVFSGTEDSLKHIVAEWYEKQSDIAKYGIMSEQISRLMNCISSINTFDDLEITDRIVYAITEIHIDTWNDSSSTEYIERLKSVKEEIENIGDNNEHIGSLELCFTGKRGNEIKKYYEHIPEGTGAILKNILMDTLDDFSDLTVNEKIAILLEMIEQQL